ncbi:MAG: glycosyltransferase family 2 protein [Phycisphaerae bacterium]
MSQIELTVIIPTRNRADALATAIDAVGKNTKLSHEIIVCDGASSDHTDRVLAEAKRKLGGSLRVIREEKPRGFVRGVNGGFRAARGRYITWLNDDARPMFSAYDNAVAQLAASPASVAFVALFHRHHGTKNVAFEQQFGDEKFQLLHVRGTLYANFCVGRRETFESLGYFDEGYWMYAADPDLSLKAWSCGKQVVPGWTSAIDHDEADDENRLANTPQMHLDNERLFDKWALPPKNLLRNDFDPNRPCTLLVSQPRFFEGESSRGKAA